MQIVDSTGPIGAQYRQMMGERAGVLKSLNYELGFRQAPDTLTTFSVAADTDAISEGSVGHAVEAGGKGERLDRALLSSFGDCVVRYSLRLPDRDRFVTATYEEMAADEERQTVDWEYIDIWGRGREFALWDRYAGELTRDRELRWCSGRNLLTGETVWLPAGLIWFNSGVLDIEDFPFGTTTNGMAAGPSPESALLNGLYELVERDGMMKTWCRQNTPPAVSMENLPEVRSFVDEYVTEGHFDLHLFSYHEEVPVDLPAIGAAAVHEGDRFPKFILGGDVSVALDDAVSGAAIETAQGWPYMYSILDEIGVDGLRPQHDHNFKANVLYYTLPEHFDEVEFLIDDDPEPMERYPTGVDWDDRRRLDHALEKFDEADVTPIAFDLTTPAMDTADVYVTRVWAPELIPITPVSTLPVEHPSLEGESLTAKPHPSP